MFRQGDVLLVRAKVPQDADVKGDLIIAYGESTGHSHRLVGQGCVLLTRGAEMFARLEQPAQLQHEEHAPIQLLRGEYAIIRQREYSPQAVRNVND